MSIVIGLQIGSFICHEPGHLYNRKFSTTEPNIGEKKEPSLQKERKRKKK
jgi:hypothetical protein